MRVHYIQHVPFENLGNIEHWANTRNHSLSCTKTYENLVFPDIDSIDFLIILGGPMNIYEETEYPWFKEEKAFIRKAIDKQKLVLGICLGAQLIADALGAKVYKNAHKEIGWFPVRKTTQNKVFKDFPSVFNAFHWHGDTFQIPEGCSRIASTDACQNQGFIYENRVIGLQFHLESSVNSVEKLIANCSDELKDEKYIQTPQEMLNSENYAEIERYLYDMLDYVGL